METPEYVTALHREDQRFAEAATRARVRQGWRAPVPSCPGWSLADLVWHLTGVQHFWTWVVRTEAEDPSAYAAPTRPDDDDLPAAFLEQARELETVLDGTDPNVPLWTWAGVRDAGWVQRRQAHEAAVHRVDAELAAGEVTPVEASLAWDGVHEWLDVMVGAAPDGAAPVVLHATDADATRTLFPDGELPVATLTGTASDLLLVVWGRLPLSAVVVDGDADRAGELITGAVGR